jgi:hypothetical protein
MHLSFGNRRRPPPINSNAVAKGRRVRNARHSTIAADTAK